MLFIELKKKAKKKRKKEEHNSFSMCGEQVGWKKNKTWKTPG